MQVFNFITKPVQRVSDHFSNTAKVAQFEGKLLAHILATNEFLKTKTFSIAGFSLGVKVTFNALRQLIEFQKAGIIDFKDWISNVIMMGGAQSIKKDDDWYEIFDFINGKFFNFYSYFDGAL